MNWCSVRILRKMWCVAKADELVFASFTKKPTGASERGCDFFRFSVGKNSLRLECMRCLRLYHRPGDKKTDTKSTIISRII